MTAKFNYSILNQTLNGILNFEKINRDFWKLNLNENLITLMPTGDNLLFEFEEPVNDINLLNQSLDDLVANHDGQEISRPRICKLLGESHEHDEYENVDYTIMPKPNLFPKRTFVKGELRKVEWYEEETFQNLVLVAEMSYTRDYFGFATSRTTVRKWYAEDGSELENIKTTNKKYSPLEQIKEGKRRRGNIVDGIQLPTMSFMVETMTVEPWNLDQMTILLMGRDFMDRFSNQFKNFIDNSSTITSGPNIGKKSVVVAMEEAATSTDTWLNNASAQLGGAKILQYLVGEFSI